MHGFIGNSPHDQSFLSALKSMGDLARKLLRKREQKVETYRAEAKLTIQKEIDAGWLVVSITPLTEVAGISGATPTKYLLVLFERRSS